MSVKNVTQIRCNKFCCSHDNELINRFYDYFLYLTTLKKEFNCNVGYSGHESIGYLICITAVLCGATSIERHLTLDRSMYGSDQSASLEPPGLERLVRDIRRLDIILGDGIKKIWPSEIPAMKKLRNL